MIINCISYVRIRKNYTIFFLDKEDKDRGSHNSEQNTKRQKNTNSSDQDYYIIEKGKVEMLIDDVSYLLERDHTISTKALIKNSKKKCFLKTIKRVYLYKLPLNKYTSIFSDFVDKMQQEKIEFLKKNYLFSSLDKKLITYLSNGCVKKKYIERKLLIEQETMPHSIYLIVVGEVLCLKNEQIIRRFSHGQVVGEMSLFTQMESFYAYCAEQDSEIYSIEYKVIDNIFNNDNMVKKLIQNIFNNAVKSSQILSKYFTINNISTIFSIFQLKYYFNDTILSKKSKKIFILLGGTLTKTKNKKSTIIYPSAELFEESLIMQSSSSNKTVMFSDECVLFEAPWNEILKNIHCYSNRSATMYDKLQYMRKVPFFKGINEIKLFSLAENLKSIEYKENDLIIQDGPISDKLFIIKSGKVKLVINNVEVKVLEPTMSFGDISSQPGSYNRKASFYAKTYLECYYLDKQVFDDAIDYEILKPYNKILMLKDITIALDQLYYIKDLGQGSYGKVYLVHDKKRLYAMKTAEIQVMIQNKDSAQCYLNEKSIMSSIEHPFIVQLINTFKTREYIFFLIEYIKGQTLREYLNKRTRHHFRNISEIVFSGGILCNILLYLQKKRIIHRDLKPDNLMIESSNGYMKAIDFGIAKDLSGKDSTHTLIGTVHYMSPETISGKNYSFPVDVWSVGVILYEIFYGQIPFGFGMKDPQDIYKDIKERKPVLPYDPKNNNVNNFIGNLLDKNPVKRMNNFCKWKSENVFIGFDFDGLIKMEVKSPFIDTNDKNVLPRGGNGTEIEGDLANTICPFHQFIKNNIFCSSNELDEVQNKDVYDYLNDF